MAYIFRPSYVRIDPRTGKRVRRKVKKWHIRYRCPDGRVLRVAGYTDKEATKQLAARLEKKAARQQEGMEDGFEQYRRVPLTVHLEDYRGHLQAKNDCQRHVAETGVRGRALLDGCAFKFIADLDADRLARWLAEFRRDGRSVSTSNGYLRAVKGFSAWLGRYRMERDPLKVLSCLNSDVDRRHERRSVPAE